MVYIFLATGFEEIEALTVVDVLRRAGIDAGTVSITGSGTVTGAHGISVEADQLFEDIDVKDMQMAVLPGGMPGATNLCAHEGLRTLLLDLVDKDRYVAAICAAPLVFGSLGILEGRTATIYPGMENSLGGGRAVDDAVIVDDKIITGKGPAFAMEFALKLVELLLSGENAEEIAKGLLYR